MRLLPTLALILPLGLPAYAQGVPYDSTVYTACLDETAAAKGDLRDCIGRASAACMQAPEGQTTIGMVMCLQSETKDWDMLLNAQYSKAMQRAEDADADLAELQSAAPPAAPVLKQAQRNWIAFRDASCTYESIRFQGGSAGGPASASCMLQLTGEQALRLRDVARGWGEE